MTGEQFTAWLVAMKNIGRIKSDAEAGRLLGRNANSIVSYKQKGTDLAVALACRALFHRLEPWG